MIITAMHNFKSFNHNISYALLASCSSVFQLPSLIISVHKNVCPQISLAAQQKWTKGKVTAESSLLTSNFCFRANPPPKTHTHTHTYTHTHTHTHTITGVVEAAMLDTFVSRASCLYPPPPPSELLLYSLKNILKKYTVQWASLLVCDDRCCKIRTSASQNWGGVTIAAFAISHLKIIWFAIFCNAFQVRVVLL